MGSDSPGECERIGVVLEVEVVEDKLDIVVHIHLVYLAAAAIGKKQNSTV